MTPRKEWDTRGYTLVKGFLGLPMCTVVQSYMLLLRNCSDRGFVDEQCPLSWSIYGDPLLDTLLSLKAGHVSQLMGEPMVPSYSYARVYARGDALPPHRDRPSCEVSLTCTIGMAEDRISDIFFKKVDDRSITNVTEERLPLPPDLRDNAQRVPIPIGDAVLYNGCGYWHWRDPIDNDFYVQLFLHYVRQDGEYAKEHFRDGRPHFGYPHVQRGAASGQPASGASDD